MRVVLLERIAHLGQMGDVASVRNGYARNYLLPQGKALRATPANLERFERERAEIEARDLDRRREAEAVAEKLNGLRVTILRQAAETGSLYGSVTPRDIVDAFADDSVQVKRQQVSIDAPIRELGIYDVEIAVHPEVHATVSVNVARTAEEAEMQALGHVIGGDSQTDGDDRTDAYESPADGAEHPEAIAEAAPESEAAASETAEAATEDAVDDAEAKTEVEAESGDSEEAEGKAEAAADEKTVAPAEAEATAGEADDAEAAADSDSKDSAEAKAEVDAESGDLEETEGKAEAAADEKAEAPAEAGTAADAADDTEAAAVSDSDDSDEAETGVDAESGDAEDADGKDEDAAETADDDEPPAKDQDAA